MNKRLFNRLYFLLVTSDNDINEKEIDLWKKIAALNSFNESVDQQMEQFKTINRTQLLNACIEDLKQTPKVQQVNMIAWMCVLANADGFMHRAEWELIYNIYHKELKLDQREILETQRELRKTVLAY